MRALLILCITFVACTSASESSSPLDFIEPCKNGIYAPGFRRGTQRFRTHCIPCKRAESRNERIVCGWTPPKKDKAPEKPVKQIDIDLIDLKLGRTEKRLDNIDAKVSRANDLLDTILTDYINIPFQGDMLRFLYLFLNNSILNSPETCKRKHVDECKYKHVGVGRDYLTYDFCSDCYHSEDACEIIRMEKYATEEKEHFKKYEREKKKHEK